MREGCWCSCDSVSSPLILVKKSVVKLQASEAAILGWYEKQHTWGMKLKVFPFKLHNIW